MARNARQNREKKDDDAIDAAGQLIVCDEDFGAAVEQMVTSAVGSPVWDTMSDIAQGQKVT